MFELIAPIFASYTPIDFTMGKEISSLSEGGMLSLLLIVVILLGISLVAEWKVFEKAGVAGWKALIPIYNTWLLAEIAGKPGWWALSSLLVVIPGVGWIVPFILGIIISLELAKKFKKDIIFAILWLIIFSPIGMIILAFGDAKYEGKSVSFKKPKVKNNKVKPLGKPKAPK